MSRAGTGLLRAILARTDQPADRILLVDFRSTDWHSLTFEGERHAMTLRIVGQDCAGVLARLTDGLEEHEFALAGQIVASIALTGPAVSETDGSLTLTVEALTLAE